MKEKSNIDKYRESGGKFDLGSSDEGKILKLFSTSNKLIAIKEKAIYSLITADQVDPKRKSENIPNWIQKKLIDKGPDSEIVSKTILTAKLLFQIGSFEKNIIDQIIGLCCESLTEFSALEKEIEGYIKIENADVHKFNISDQSAENYIIPSIPDITTRAKSIFQKTDQIAQIIIDLIRLFYPKDKKLKLTPFKHLYQIIKNKYGEEHDYSIYIQKNLKFFCQIRSIRNGLDHRLDSCKISDFTVEKDGAITHPTIKLKDKECPLSICYFNIYVSNVLKAYPYLFENLLMILADANLKQSGMNYRVEEIPESRRIFPKVRYALWSPVGEGGFYLLNM